MGLLFTFSLSAQTSDLLIISEINNTVNEIDNNPDYKRLHEDGELTKRELLIFEKHIGMFYSNVVYSDTLILLTENEFSYQKNSTIRNEKYYFKDNKLIKYNEEIWGKDILVHKLCAYFINERLIKIETQDNFEFDTEKQKKVIEKSKEEISLRQLTTSEWKQLFGK
tara:strand:- start:1040 stop:1540 length:501 start_codon:yes stop_codon:yes gene_type:complete